MTVFLHNLAPQNVLSSDASLLFCCWSNPVFVSVSYLLHDMRKLVGGAKEAVM